MIKEMKKFVVKKKMTLFIIVLVYIATAFFVTKKRGTGVEREITNYYVQIGFYMTKDRGIEFIFSIQNLRAEMNITYSDYIRMQERSSDMASIRSTSLLSKDPKLVEIVNVLMAKLKEREELIDKILKQTNGVWLSKSRLAEKKTFESAHVRASTKVRLLLLLLSFVILIGGMFLFYRNKLLVNE